MNKQKAHKVLFFLMVWPESKASAAGWRIQSLFTFFKQKGYEIHALSAAQKTALSDDLSEMGIHCKEIKENDGSIEKVLSSIAPEIVVFDRFITEEKFSWRLKHILPDAIRILDTEDLHFLRNARKIAHQKNEPIHYNHDFTYRELASIFRSDLSLIISKFEVDLLVNQMQVPESLLHFLPLITTNKNNFTQKSFQDRKDLMFVGNFLHEPNRDAVIYLKNEIWPLLRKKRKDLSLYIYGAYPKPSDLQMSKPYEGFNIVGWTKDVLKEMVSKKICLLPLRIGAGQKGKLIDALLTQTPVVATTTAIESMCTKENLPGLLADTADDFVAAILQLLDDEKLWREKQKLAAPLLSTHFNFTKHYEAFFSRLDLLMGDLESFRSKQILSSVFWHQNMRSTEFMSRWIELKNKDK